MIKSEYYNIAYIANNNILLLKLPQEWSIKYKPIYFIQDCCTSIDQCKSFFLIQVLIQKSVVQTYTRELKNNDFIIACRFKSVFLHPWGLKYVYWGGQDSAAHLLASNQDNVLNRRSNNKRAIWTSIAALPYEGTLTHTAGRQLFRAECHYRISPTLGRDGRSGGWGGV